MGEKRHQRGEEREDFSLAMRLRLLGPLTDIQLAKYSIVQQFLQLIRPTAQKRGPGNDFATMCVRLFHCLEWVDASTPREPLSDNRPRRFGFASHNVASVLQPPSEDVLGYTVRVFIVLRIPVKNRRLAQHCKQFAISSGEENAGRQLLDERRNWGLGC